MTALLPLRYMGEGEFRTTTKDFAALCDKTLVIGEVLTWEQVHQRSRKSHNHFFACIHEAWLNLPGVLVLEFPTEEHLRKWALIKAGFCTRRDIVCANGTQAAELIKAMREADEYALVEIRDTKIVTIWRAESQSEKAMGKKRFQESKEKVLDVLSQVIGTDAGALKERAAA